VVAAHNAAMARETEGRDLDREQLASGVRAALSGAVGAEYFVAEAGGRVVGQAMVTYEWSDWRDGYFLWFQSVYVVPEQRRRGVFRALDRAVREFARERGDVIGLRLYVERNNGVARRAYERLGMRATEYDLLEDDWRTPRATEG